MQAVAVGVHGLHCLGVPVGGHFHPCIILGPGGVDLGVGIHWSTVRAQHPSDMVSVEMGQKQAIHIIGRESQRIQTPAYAPFGQSEPGIEQQHLAVLAYQKGADGGRYGFLETERCHKFWGSIGEKSEGLTGGLVAQPDDFSFRFAGRTSACQQYHCRSCDCDNVFHSRECLYCFCKFTFFRLKYK